MWLAAVGVAVGEVCLLLDLWNRVFGSFYRTLWGMAWRAGAVLLPAIALAAPFVLLRAGVDTLPVTLLAWLAGGLGWLIALHFLVPYKWGVRRIHESHHEHGTRPLGEDVVLQDCRVRLPGLPEGCDHLTVVALSDLHCTTHERVRTLITALRNLEAEAMFDIVLVLGDLGENPDLLPEVMEALGSIPSRYGVYMVRGNHDFERGRAPLIKDLAAAYEIVLLENSVHQVAGTDIGVVGLELPWNRAPLPEPVKNQFAIGLSHTPDNVRRLSRLHVDIAFAGHTHGGRLKLPLVGHVFVPGLLGRFMERGLFRLDGTLLYVTAGVGYTVAKLGKKGEILRVLVRRPKHDDAPGRQPPQAQNADSAAG